MHNRKWLVGLILVITTVLLMSGTVWLLEVPNRVVDQEVKASSSIECWIYTKELTDYIKEFERDNPQFNVEVRGFSSAEQLYEELSAAISANAAPQIAEISGIYGVAQLAESGMLIQLKDQIAPEVWQNLHPAFVSQFTYKQDRFALPIGGEAPVIYYNANVAKHVNLDPSLYITNASRLMNAAEKLTIDVNNDGLIEIWGLGIDAKIPWYLMNWANQSSLKGLDQEYWSHPLRLWQQFVYEKQVMKPLQHQLALSNFINGNVGLFISSSHKTLMLDRYIGGKFQYNVLPFPLFNGGQLIPSASGLTLLQSSSKDKEKLALQLMSYLIGIDQQKTMLERTGQIPARLDIINKLMDDEALSEREQSILAMQNRFAQVSPGLHDTKLWDRIMEITEMLESQSGVDLVPLTKELNDLTTTK